jgi:glucuronate isomerase
MSTVSINHPDRLFPAGRIAIDLYESVCDLPIVSPHGHTDPAWFALDERFPDAVDLLLKPDHYVVRMLYSQGISMESLGIESVDGKGTETDARGIWRTFARNYHLFAGTPSRIWLDHVFGEVFGLSELLNEANADAYFDHINEHLATPEFRPRALFDRFNIEVLATTESPLDSLEHHKTISDSDWNGRVITTYRPDPVVDPEFENFAVNVTRFGEFAGEDVSTWSGYLAAHRSQRAVFQSMGATATDHGHPTAATADLDQAACEELYLKALEGRCTAADAEQWPG